ncbi:helix-turn-helix domain-containing protein [Flavobacterium sp. LC2016-23]|uniref:helix-turn-helix transcriptional regulator n=1 Tax=Flavobacterium sp. LC2016-23 TaxID=2666330 RepID=UPI0012AFE421|nr:helix-turn-helix transcriptional regulator [Flavobacterium sp. LC2016-23]MRX41813.1 helix-turn-helix domain-containing protein [Flavobacterium sp. LC2016-23]
MIKNRLKAERKEKKLSQEQIAELLFMDQSQYNRREKGLIKISTEEWKKMAKILNVKVEDIFESDDTLFSINTNDKEKGKSKNGIKIKIIIPPSEINELYKKLEELLIILKNKI